MHFYLFFLLDIDECALQSHNCGMGFVCENTVGSFVCNPKNKCVSGFMQDSHGNCIGKIISSQFHTVFVQKLSKNKIHN